jgi:SAM-dependent methyltransferase
MHDTSLLAGSNFSEIYGSSGKVVIDIGGMDVYNCGATLRKFFEEKGMKYICVDLEPHSTVDIVVKPGEKLPFDDGSIDLIVSTSCFEHDPCFWLTFKEMCRIVKVGGYIYVNAPSNGNYHGFPGDNWRFYSDAGQALAYWSGIKMGDEKIFPSKVEETFHILPLNDIWCDFVCVWKRIDKCETSILVSEETIKNAGPLENSLTNKGLKLIKKMYRTI